MVGGVDTMRSYNRMKTEAIPVQRTTRRLSVRNMTSLPAGKMVPLAAFPLLREDALSMSRFQINCEMMETAEILMNAVYFRVMAYLVPNLAFKRFNGIDQLNRSYQKEPETEGGQVVPYFTTFTNAGTSEIMNYLGKHAKSGDVINGAYVEAYNEIWNFRAKNRSDAIVLRNEMDHTLAKAFWQHQQLNPVVPDFDAAAIEGEVPLNVVPGAERLPVRGIGLHGAVQTTGTMGGVRQTGNYQGQVGAPGWNITSGAPTAGLANMAVAADQPVSSGFPLIFAELADQGITVSLANIELARQTQAFALLRKQYEGHDDDYIIDLLMQGIQVPEQVWRQPILLADRTATFGMAKRYASDSQNLTESVVNSATSVALSMTCPRCPTGGVVMIVAEATPEQMWERRQDTYLYTTDVDKLPNFLRDTLDPQKVEIVTNKQVDVAHATPTATFGYAPLNWKWANTPPNIGGKFLRPAADDPFDEDRQRLWSPETLNPTLSEDFYLCTSMHQKVFVVTNQDPFEAVTRGEVTITGNTVFGRLLIEGSDSYEKVMAEAPPDRIEPAAAAAAEVEA